MVCHLLSWRSTSKPCYLEACLMFDNCQAFMNTSQDKFYHESAQSFPERLTAHAVGMISLRWQSICSAAHTNVPRVGRASKLPEEDQSVKI